MKYVQRFEITKVTPLKDDTNVIGYISGLKVTAKWINHPKYSLRWIEPYSKTSEALLFVGLDLDLDIHDPNFEKIYTETELPVE